MALLPLRPVQAGARSEHEQSETTARQATALAEGRELLRQTSVAAALVEARGILRKMGVAASLDEGRGILRKKTIAAALAGTDPDTTKQLGQTARQALQRDALAHGQSAELTDWPADGLRIDTEPARWMVEDFKAEKRHRANMQVVADAVRTGTLAAVAGAGDAPPVAETPTHPKPAQREGRKVSIKKAEAWRRDFKPLERVIAGAERLNTLNRIANVTITPDGIASEYCVFFTPGDLLDALKLAGGPSPRTYTPNIGADQFSRWCKELYPAVRWPQGSECLDERKGIVQLLTDAFLDGEQIDFDGNLDGGGLPLLALAGER